MRKSQAVQTPLLIGFLACLFNSAFATYPHASSSGPILSEVMADPASVPDAQGEFLELSNPGDDTLRLDSLRITVVGQSIILKPLLMAPGGFLLLCRDSLTLTNGGMMCQRQWIGLALANSRSDTISLSWEGGRGIYLLPIAKPGVSWENTGEQLEDYHRFLASRAAWASADSATPGYRNSRSVAPPRFDLGITQVTVDKRGTISVLVRDLGSEPLAMPGGHAAHTYLTIRLDRDWDGDWETLLDSQVVSGLPSGGDPFFIPLGPGIEGLVLIGLGADDNADNNAYSLLSGSTHALVLNEWCPAPDSGAPEWVEVRNATLDSSGQGGTLNLAQVEFNGQALGGRAGDLGPGEYLILTEDADRFRTRYGMLKVRVLELTAWPGLRNAGDTLRLSVRNFLLDSVVYRAGDFPNDGVCLVRGPGQMETAEGTPGFTGEVMESFSWDLGARIASAGQPLEVEVRAPAGFHYTVRVFDLEGNCVRSLGGGGPGRHIHRWSGESAQGGMLRPGPYLICLSADGYRTRKRAVALTGGR